MTFLDVFLGLCVVAVAACLATSRAMVSLPAGAVVVCGKWRLDLGGGQEAHHHLVTELGHTPRLHRPALITQTNELLAREHDERDKQTLLALPPRIRTLRPALDPPQAHHPRRLTRHPPTNLVHTRSVGLLRFNGGRAP